MSTSHSLKMIASIAIIAMIYTLLASCGGGSGSVSRSGESDQLTIEPRPPQDRPDLAVASPSVSNGNPAPGAGFTLSAMVNNTGSGQAAATTLRYYRSTDATITSSDTELGTNAVPGLAPSGSDSQSMDLTAPSAPGTYYYGVCVDAVAGESNTSNNCSAAIEITVPEPDHPELAVVSPSVSTPFPAIASRFTLSAAVRNGGKGQSGATTLRYYRSTDATITSSDTEVGTAAVAALAPSGSDNQSVDLTAPSTPGTYYYGACVDALADESNTANNCSTAVEITVLATQQQVQGHPDLEVRTPTVSDASPETGATFNLSATVSNTGDAESPATTLRYYRSTDPTITTSDTAVGTDDVGVLAAPGTSSESISLAAPVTAGAYYYGACVDSVTDESDSTDNCSASVKVDVEEPKHPDLEVGTPSVSDASPETAASFTLSATVSNTGDAESPATTLRYYRSTDPTITTSDTAVGTDDVGVLAASGTSSESISLTAPATAGAYYYGACVDSVTDESDTTNNCSAPVKVEAVQPSELSVEVTAPQEWAPVGETVNYKAKVVDSEGTEMSGYTFAWKSNDTSKATVNSSGVVTAVAVGDATITATASTTGSTTVKARPLARSSGDAGTKLQSTLSGSLKMNVVKPVDRIEFSPSSLSFDAVGELKTVTATLYDADNNEMRPTHWGWGSANETVAEVYSRYSSSSVPASVQSIGEGTTTVSLSANGTKASMNVTVTLPTARVDINPRSLTFEALGDTKSVTIRVLDENGDEDEDATWLAFGFFSPCCVPDARNYRGGVAFERVGDGLEITSKGPGTGQITISSTDVASAILGVTVRMKPATLEVSPSSPSLAVNGTTTLSATIKDANGNSIQVSGNDGQGGLVVYWETNDDTVATVVGGTAREEHNTGATATVTAVGAGTATITGTWASRVRGTATVTVTE